MFHSQPLSAPLRNSPRVLPEFYFLYLDVGRGRLILLVKKFIFPSPTTKVIHGRNKSQETAISSGASPTRRLPQEEPTPTAAPPDVYFSPESQW